MCGVDGLDVGIGADGLILSFHQLSVSCSSESSVTWTVLATSVVNGAAEWSRRGSDVGVGDQSRSCIPDLIVDVSDKLLLLERQSPLRSLQRSRYVSCLINPEARASSRRRVTCFSKSQ